MKKAGALVFLLLPLSTLWILLRQRRIDYVFRNAALGTQMTKQTNQLGHPWKRAKCGQTFGGGVPNGCATEILYAAPLAPLIPTYWAFRYDSAGRLIGKYRYSSP
jgi:hypothetical protein